MSDPVASFSSSPPDGVLGQWQFVDAIFGQRETSLHHATAMMIKCYSDDVLFRR